MLEKNDVSKNNYYLIAAACLHVAAKFDELDSKIPPIPELLLAAIMKLPTARIDDLKECDNTILHTLAWNLKILTPLVFVETLLTQGILHTSDKIEDKYPVSIYTAKVVSQRALKFADIALGCKYQ